MANGVAQQQNTKGGPLWTWVEDLWFRPDVRGITAFLLDRGGNVYDVRAWSAIGDGQTDATEAFELAIEAIQNSRTGQGTLFIADGTYFITANVTIPETVTLIVRQGGRIRPAEGVIVRINGPIEAGPYRIFEGGSAAVPPEPQRVFTVVVTPAAFSLEPPNTRQLGAQALDSQGLVIPAAAFTWSSDTPAVATVDGGGLVTAVANGTATITARSGGVDGTSMVTVETIPAPPNLARIDVTPSSATIEDGQTQQFNAAGFDSNDSSVAITPVWASTDTSIATVDQTGLATAVAPGQCMITATDDGVQGAATLNVTTVASPEVTTIVVTPTQVSVEEGDTVQLTAQAFDQNGQEVMNVQFLWQSSNTGRATVDQNGLVTAVSQGAVAITATANDVVGTSDVNVTAPPSGSPLLFSDDFESATVGSDLQGRGGNGFRWTGSSSGVTVSDEHSFSGSKSLKFAYPGESLCEDSAREQNFILGPAGRENIDEIWIEYMVRVPDNFRHRSGCGSTNNKMLSLWAEHYDNRQGDAEITTEWHRHNDDRSFFSASVYTDVSVEENRKLFGDTQRQTIRGPTLFSSALAGQWVRIRYHYRIGRGTSQDPTIIDAWRDDVKVCEVEDGINMRDYWVKDFQPRQPGSPWFRHGYIFGWSNSGFTDDTDFYVDDLKIWTQDPNWTF